jgi:hypothetical protein
MPDRGPYETSEQVRQLPAVRAVYDAMRAAPRSGAGHDGCERLVTSACEEARVTLGAYDARIIRWLANWDPETCAVVAGLIARKRPHPEGTVTGWALAYTHRPAVPDLPARRVVQPYPSEAEAREAVAQLCRLSPEDEPALMRREVGPWTPVPGEGDFS